MIAQTDSDPCAQCWARIAALAVCFPERTMQALYHNRATLEQLISNEVIFSVAVCCRPSTQKDEETSPLVLS